MVPQYKDCIIQSVQTIFHSRLKGKGGLWKERFRKTEEEKEKRAEQLSISILGAKLKTLIVWSGLGVGMKKKIKKVVST